MPAEIKGIMVSRLLVLISVILVPIAIFLIYNLVGFNVWWTEDAEISFWIVRVFSPLVFSVAWLFFLLLFANRFAETIDTMGKTTGVVPLRLKLFYGINALFVLFIFVFPIITPVVAILSYSSMAWRLTTFRKKEWEDQSTPFITKILMVAVSIVPIFFTISVLPDYIELAVFLWEEIWLPLLPTIFTVSYCLCTALAIGSFFIMIANSGVSEYEQIFEDPEKNKSMYHIRIAELLLFIFLLFLAFGGFEVIELFYNAGFFLVVIVFIVNFFSGRRKSSKFKSHIFGYILAAVFMGSNLFFIDPTTSGISQFIAEWSILISAVLFIFVMMYSFVKLDDSEF